MNDFKIFWQIIEEKHKKKFLFLLFIMLLGAVFETLGVTLIIPVILTIISENLEIPLFLSDIFPFLLNSSKEQLVIYASIFFISFFIVKSFFLAFLVFFQSNFVYEIQEYISTKLYKIYVDQPYSFHLKKNSGDIISIVITESMQFAMSFTFPLILILTDIFVISGIFLLLVLIEPVGAFSISILFFIGSIILFSFSKKRSEVWGEKRQQYEAKRIRTAQQGISGIKDIKLYGLENFFATEYSKNTFTSLSSARKQTILQGMPKIYFELLTVMALSSLIILFIISKSQPNELIVVLGIFAMAAFKLLPSISRLITNFQAIKFGSPVVKLLKKELDLDQEQNKRDIYEKINFKDEIFLKDVSFSYENSKNTTLKNINISIKSGQSIGFIGKSGAGKSTLIDIILGLLNSTEGSIFIDKKELNHLNLKSWQKNIGYVPQSAYFLDDSLKNNIAFGIPISQIDEEKIKKAINLAQLEDLVSSMPDGYETLIGESGIRLSGGQRQRIAIARALYDDPSILVLDEATSSLDTKTEIEVMKAVDDLKGKKTLMIIAHRYSTVKNCDFLFKLENGEIISKGMPDKFIS